MRHGSSLAILAIPPRLLLTCDVITVLLPTKPHGTTAVRVAWQPGQSCKNAARDSSFDRGPGSLWHCRWAPRFIQQLNFAIG